MLKRFFTSYWSIPIVLIVVIGCNMMAIYLLNSMIHETPHRNTCPSNLKQIALGIMMYSQDYDDKLPPAIFGGETVGWVSGLQPYLRSYQIFQCPADQHEPPNDPHLPGFTDYWMNQNAAKVDLYKLEGEPGKMILLGDGDGASPASTASYAINELPASWLQSSDSPARRHVDGANYAFVDGHVKWLKPEDISQETPVRNNNMYTFHVK